MKVDKELIEAVAKNARLILTEKEKDMFVHDFQDILDTFAILDACDVKNEKPVIHAIELKDHTREDIIESSLSQKDALKNAKHTQDGYFLGPKTL